MAPIGSWLASVLKRHLAGLESASGFLFSNNQGRPLDPKSLAQKQLYPAQDRLGLPRFSWHTLRHLHATRLGFHNVPVPVAQAQLRHSDPAVTLGRYTHVDEGSRRQVVELIENDLFSIVLDVDERTQVATPAATAK